MLYVTREAASFQPRSRRYVAATFATIAALVFLFVTAPKSYAVVIYDFVGTCDNGCIIAGSSASGVLTLHDTYTPGTALVAADFASFSYSDDNTNFAVPSGSFSVGDFYGALPVASSSDVDLVLGGLGISGPPNLSFQTVSAATAASGFAHWLASIGGTVGSGVDYTWTLRSGDVSQVPVPAALPLFAGGIGLFGFIGWRRKRTSTS